MSHHSYVVTSTRDTTAHGTLRSAIHFANAHPGTVIAFAAKLAHHTIKLSRELPLIIGNHTVIDGSGAHDLTISGAHKYRVFFVGAPIAKAALDHLHTWRAAESVLSPHSRQEVAAMVIHGSDVNGATAPGCERGRGYSGRGRLWPATTRSMPR